MSNQYVAENATEQERLRALVGRITDEELGLVVYKEGWTVAAMLAHMAFWDRYGLAVLRRWKQEGVQASAWARGSTDSNAVNDGLLPLALAMPPRVAAGLAVSAAEAVDREIAAFSTDFIKAVAALDQPFRLNRSLHRKLHLDEIEALLKSRKIGK